MCLKFPLMISFMFFSQEHIANALRCRSVKCNNGTIAAFRNCKRVLLFHWRTAQPFNKRISLTAPMRTKHLLKKEEAVFAKPDHYLRYVPTWFYIFCGGICNKQTLGQTVVSPENKKRCPIRTYSRATFLRMVLYNSGIKSPRKILFNRL